MKEIHSILEFAKTQKLTPAEHAWHNTRRALDLSFFLTAHLLLSFLVIIVPLWAALALGLLSGYFAYCYLVLAVHEGAHDLLFVSANKKRMQHLHNLMPAISMLIGFPGFTVYLRDHVLHHAYLSTPKDAQNTARTRFRDLPAFYFVRYRPRYPLAHFFEHTNVAAYVVAGALKIAHLYTLYTLGGPLAIVLGVIWPLFVGLCLNMVRISLRHYNLYPNHKWLRSRSYVFTGAGLFGPGGLKYHFEHHLYPDVPSRKLKAVHQYARAHLPANILATVHYTNFALRDFL